MHSIRGLRHIGDLKEANRRLHQLSTEIDNMCRNKQHLLELEADHAQLAADCADLERAWNEKYAAAAEYRDKLRKAIRFIERHPDEEFQHMLADIRAGRSVDTTKPPFPIVDSATLEDDENKSTESVTSILTPPDSPLVSTVVTTPASNHDTATDLFRQQQDIFRNQHRRSLRKSSVECRLLALEQLHADLDAEMRQVGSKTCLLTVQNKQLRDAVDQWREKMKSAPEDLYRRELSRWIAVRTNILQSVLEFHDRVPFVIYEKYSTMSRQQALPRRHTS